MGKLNNEEWRFWGRSSSQDMRHQCWGAAERLQWQSHKYQKYNLAPETKPCLRPAFAPRLNNGTLAYQVTETRSSYKGLLSTEFNETANSRTDLWLAELFQQQQDRTWYGFAIVRTAGRTSHRTIRSHRWRPSEVCSTWSCRSSWRSPQSAAPSPLLSPPTSPSSFQVWVQPLASSPLSERS